MLSPEDLQSPQAQRFRAELSVKVNELVSEFRNSASGLSSAERSTVRAIKMITFFVFFFIFYIDALFYSKKENY
jgi:hypothetical protein